MILSVIFGSNSFLKIDSRGHCNDLENMFVQTKICETICDFYSNNKLGLENQLHSITLTTNLQRIDYY
jgi:hypothetical protein